MAIRSAGSASSDQAQGLRRLFEGRPTRALAVVSNPAVTWSGLLLEQMGAALGSAGLHTLIVDASETAPEPGEWASLDLRWAVEVQSDQFSYLGARGLIRRHVDGEGRAPGLLRALSDAVPQADVVLVHAPAGDLMRVLTRHDWRPIVLADTTPTGITHAYGSLKTLRRAALTTFDFLVDARSQPVLGPRLAMRLADSASRFLSWPAGIGVVLTCPVGRDPGEQSRLQDLIRAQWAQAPTCAVRTSAVQPKAH
jgi:flagellar biosynthesis protein FlhG